MIMESFFNFRQSSQLQRYKKWREIGKRLNHQIMKQISKDVIFQAADDFRFLKKSNSLRFDSESETHFLMDRAIHDIPMDGGRIIERYLDQNKKILTGDEQKLLDALADAIYSLFIVQRVEAGYGLHLMDVFLDKEIFLVDINLSRTVLEGHVLATRMVSVDGITFTTGCVCPFPPEYLARLKDNFVRLFEKKKHQMTWAEMMRKYNPYFFIIMKQAGIEIDFGDAV